MEEKECIFCKIARGEVPSDKIYEDEHTFAFLDIEPNNLGHSLVIPKEHFKNVYETPDEVLGQIMATVKKVTLAVKKGMGAEGINIANNNEPAAGQLVFHIHVHIIPRYSNDGFHHWPAKPNFTPEQFKEAAENIKKAL
ncbi:MAG: HIT family protein [Patescibacteria group bacterium]|nr:HIT family protein [bacterium]MDZ4241115.1 HIT family protein [Patescibacteria group bacterium]